MPWNWQARGAMSTDVGGSRGSYEEAKISHAWPNYEAEYLAMRLREGGGKYENGPIGKANDELANYVYFDKVTEDYKLEADECLKREFNQWLAGEHPENDNQTPYANAPGKPVRKAVYRDGEEEPGQKLKRKWCPTHWGKAQLTHLPGVREYLREQKITQMKNDFAMNLLAEHGPQNLEEAWVYFKHWVKGRPIAPEICMTVPSDKPGYKSILGRIPPDNEKGEIISGSYYSVPPEPTDIEKSNMAETLATNDAESYTNDGYTNTNDGGSDDYEVPRTELSPDAVNFNLNDELEELLKTEFTNIEQNLNVDELNKILEEEGILNPTTSPYEASTTSEQTTIYGNAEQTTFTPESIDNPRTPGGTTQDVYRTYEPPPSPFRNINNREQIRPRHNYNTRINRPPQMNNLDTLQ